MKKILFILLAACSILQVSAQIKEGTISYERKINLWKRIQSEERRAAVPEFKVTKHVLLFTDTTSLFKPIKEEEDQINPFGGDGEGRGGFGGGGFGGGLGGRMSRMMGGLDGDIYKNFSDCTAMLATEQGGKNFLVVDSLKKQPWRISAETKIIMGYTCRKATLKQKSGFGNFGGGRRNRQRDNNGTTKRVAKEIEVAAWFAEKILSPAGPDNYGQLPGVILEVDVDNGSIIYTVTDIKTTVSSKDLKEPKKGKKMSREE